MTAPVTGATARRGSPHCSPVHRQLLLLPLRSVLLVDLENVVVRSPRMRSWLRTQRAAAGPVDAAFASGAVDVLTAHGAACQEAGLRLLPAWPGRDGADRALMAYASSPLTSSDACL